MTELHDLPPEVVLCLLKLLTCKDVCRLAQSCRFFREVCEVDGIWRNLCFKDYGICSIEKWCVNSFRELYKIVLFKYGFLIDKLWKMNIYPYGGIMSLEIEPGRIVAYLWYPPKPRCVTHPFTKQEIFELRVEYERCTCNCLSGTSVHPLEKLCIISSVDNLDSPVKFSFECPQRGYHLQSNHVDDVYFDAFGPFKTYAELSGNIECERLQWSNCVNGESLPKSGLYKGTYSAHGIEVIMVHVSSIQIIGTKITGDPNIPASKVTFKINVDHEVNLDELKELYSTESDEPEVSLTEFRVPLSYELDIDEEITSKVKARYHGVGQIAYEGYTNPSWTPTQFALLNESCFAIFWIELENVSVYYRVEC